MQDLADELRIKGALRTPALTDALLNVDRGDFVPAEHARFAYVDDALSIGHGQTISQPYTVIFMLELLEVKPGERVFEVGYGSGWQTAMLAWLVGGGVAGRSSVDPPIYAMELVPELCEFGRTNVAKYPGLVERVRFLCGNARDGVPEMDDEFFDRIIVAANVTDFPSKWRDQLKVGGIMVYPAQDSIFREVKISQDEFIRQQFSGFVFVPMVG